MNHVYDDAIPDEAGDAVCDVPEQAAEITGMDPGFIRELIETSDEHGYAIHGRRQTSFRSVQVYGILPKTPEGGNVSYWNSGSRMFGVPDGERLQTRDSTVFNYAHSADDKTRYINVAVTRHTNLEEAGIRNDGFRPDDYMIVRDPVPRSLIHLLHVEIPLGGAAREYQQRAERALVMALRDIFSSYTPGALLRR